MAPCAHLLWGNGPGEWRRGKFAGVGDAGVKRWCLARVGSGGVFFSLRAEPLSAAHHPSPVGAPLCGCHGGSSMEVMMDECTGGDR